jgi:hypothetical protein
MLKEKINSQEITRIRFKALIERSIEKLKVKLDENIHNNELPEYAVMAYETQLANLILISENKRNLTLGFNRYVDCLENDEEFDLSSITTEIIEESLNVVSNLGETVSQIKTSRIDAVAIEVLSIIEGLGVFNTDTQLSPPDPDFFVGMEPGIDKKPNENLNRLSLEKALSIQLFIEQLKQNGIEYSFLKGEVGHKNMSKLPYYLIQTIINGRNIGVLTNFSKGSTIYLNNKNSSKIIYNSAQLPKPDMKRMADWLGISKSSVDENLRMLFKEQEQKRNYANVILLLKNTIKHFNNSKNQRPSPATELGRTIEGVFRTDKSIYSLLVNDEIENLMKKVLRLYSKTSTDALEKARYLKLLRVIESLNNPPTNQK